jgi:hypothetical protein
MKLIVLGQAGLTFARAAPAEIRDARWQRAASCSGKPHQFGPGQNLGAKIRRVASPAAGTALR